ncbi:MAG: AsmA family protein [Methylococcales bacterium]|nr:AsmA family protein [Methylococcales bacterium]
MSKPIKILLSILALIILSIVIAIFSLPFFINPNNFKPEIIAAVKNNTGRDLTLTGDIKISLFPWTGVSTGKMTLSNAIGFQEKTFASLEESAIKINLLPLFLNKIEIDQVIIKGLILNLEKNSQGINNWDDLTRSNVTNVMPLSPIANNNKPEATNNGLTLLAINGVAIENAVINWKNQRSGKILLIKDININSNKFAYDEPVTVDLSLMAMSPETNWTESIKLRTGLTVNQALTSLALDHSDLQLKTIIKANNNEDKSILAALTINNVAMDRTKQSLNVSGLKLTSQDISLSAEITGNTNNSKFSFQGPITIAPFNLRNVLNQLDIKVPALQDEKALSKAAATFNLLVTNDAADLQNISLTLDGTQIKGSTTITDFSKPAITFNLASDNMDLDPYLAPIADKKSRPINSPAITLALGTSTLPVELSKKLIINGQLSLERLKVNAMTMQDVQLNLDVKEGLINAQQSAKGFYAGAYNGVFSFDMRNNKPILSINEKIVHVQIEPLLNDFNGATNLSGLLDLSTQLEGQGNNAKELKSSLTGNLSFLLTDCIIKGFNLQKIIDDAKTLIKEPTLPANNKNDQMLFSKLSGTATINNGLVQNNDLIGIASKMHLNGKGTADLNSEKLDYKLNARYIKTKATTTEPEQLIDTPINVNIAGTFTKPTYTVDLAAILSDKNKAKIDQFIDKNHNKIDEIAHKIDKKIGPRLGNLLKGLFKKPKE